MKEKILTIMFSLFCLTAAGQNNQKSTLLGDANGDNQISYADIEFVVSVIMEKSPGDGDLARADINNDGKVNATDLVFLTNMIYPQALSIMTVETIEEFVGDNEISANKTERMSSEKESITIYSENGTPYCSSKALDFSGLKDIKAYIVSGYDRGTSSIWLSRVYEVDAGTPIIIIAKPGSYNIPILKSSLSYYNNMLVGNLGSEFTISALDGLYMNFYLKDGKFIRSNGAETIGKNMCYLRIPITINAEKTGSAQTLTIGPNGISTYCSEYDLDFTNIDEVKAYTSIGYDQNRQVLLLSPIYKVPAGTGILLKSQPNAVVEVPSKAANSIYQNLFVGNLNANMTINESNYFWTNYYLKEDKFIKVNNSIDIEKNNCFLQIMSFTEGFTAKASGRIEMNGELFQTKGCSLNTVESESIPSNGVFSVSVYDNDSPQIIWLTDSEDKILMMARGLFANKSDIKINEESTALALVSIYPDFAGTNSTSFESLITRIKSSPNYSTFLEEVKSSIKDKRDIFDPTNTNIKDGIESVVEDVINSFKQAGTRSGRDVEGGDILDTYPIKLKSEDNKVYLSIASMCPGYECDIFYNPRLSTQLYRSGMVFASSSPEFWSLWSSSKPYGEESKFTLFKEGQYRFVLDNQTKNAIDNLKYNLFFDALDVIGAGLSKSDTELLSELGNMIALEKTLFNINTYNSPEDLAQALINLYPILLSKAGSIAKNMGKEKLSKLLTGISVIFSAGKGIGGYTNRILNYCKQPHVITFDLCQYNNTVRVCEEIILHLSKGNGQKGVAGVKLANPLKVFEEFKNGIKWEDSPYRVKFEVVAGGGSLSNELVEMDFSKQTAETYWTLGEFGEQKVRAVVVDLVSQAELSNEVFFIASIVESPVDIIDFKQTGSDYKKDAFENNGKKYSYKFNCATTVEIKSLDNVEDWGYIYIDPEGGEKELSLMEFGTNYTDTRYAYFRNEPRSTVTFQPYVKYKVDTEKLSRSRGTNDVEDDGYCYGDPVSFDLIYKEPQLCPDNKHPHLIDLGLPSGTKWACCNVGASNPSDCGGYYAWGETSEKDEYVWENYSHYAQSNYSTYSNSGFINIGSEISSTSYDVAHTKWGESWQMPSADQCRELIDNTTSCWISHNGINGMKFIGPNGNFIFIPAAGDKWNKDSFDKGERGSYWSSTQHGAKEAAWCFFVNSEGTSVDANTRYGGMTVRPVQPGIKIETGDAIDIKTTSAKLNGKVENYDKEDKNIKFMFLYSTSEDIQNSSDGRTVEATCDDNGNLNADVSDLTDYTNYYYAAAYKEGDADYVLGEVKSFKTQVKVTTRENPNTTVISATLQGVCSKGVSIAGFSVKKEGESEYTQYEAYPDENGNFSAGIEDLDIDTKYFYYAFAEADDQTYKGTEYSFTTKPLCPDDHHPHMIDLGLPSGTKWACCNVGASKPEEYGGYYAWGETYEKDWYSWKSFSHAHVSEVEIIDEYYADYCDEGLYYKPDDIGEKISATQYDAAHVNFEGEWCLPSFDECQALVKRKSMWTTFNGVNGRIIVGDNGNGIFLPAAGVRYKDIHKDIGYGYYQSGTLNRDVSPWPPAEHDIIFDVNSMHIGYLAVFYGKTIRPVQNRNNK